MKTYAEILAYYRRLCLFDSVQSLVNWDFEAIMPQGGSAQRQEQLALLASLSHEQWTAPHFTEAVLRCVDDPALNAQERTQITRLAKQVAMASAVDRAFTERFVTAQAACGAAWREAKAGGNFSAVAPLLTDVLRLTQEWADRVIAHPPLHAWYKNATRYDVLLDQYEPGFGAAAVTTLFTELRNFLTPDLLGTILARQPALPEARHFAATVETQERWALAAVTALGFDLNRGRLDRSTHPFCGGPGGDDVRLTTRYRADTWTPALYGVIHETGHGLYEQHLPVALRYTPCGRAATFGVHESQSRFFENYLGRSRAGCAWLATLTGIPAATIYAQVNHVQQTFIRVEADEVTYNIHIMIRMALEQQLIAGTLAAKDLPDAWDAQYQQLLGIRPASPTTGCMQDVHWYWGTLGYFPTYTLGTVLAAALFADFKKTHPDWETAIAAGDFRPAREFMQDRVYRHAALGNSPETIAKATGGPLRTQPFADYVKEKYL